MKIGLVTDAWRPQTNGVVTTLQRTLECAARAGHEIAPLTPDGLATLPCPSYPEIRLALRPFRAVLRFFAAHDLDALHIATEGPLGIAARHYALRHRLAFTTSYHTQFPEYVSQRWPIPRAAGYAFMRWFHGAAERTLVGTESVRRELHTQRLARLALWSRGVDADRFAPTTTRLFDDCAGPIMVYAGRVALEKNVAAFLEARVVGTKVIVGDGPALSQLQRRFPAAIFTGYLYGAELAQAIGSADVFVFPSRTDTFGLVMLEAMACGVPVAAYPVTGPRDVVQDGVTGALDEDISVAIRRALTLSRDDCRRFAESHTWERATGQFLDALVPVRGFACASNARSQRFAFATPR